LTQVVWELPLVPIPFSFGLTPCYTANRHYGVDMKLGARQELLVWLFLLALGIGPLLFFPGFHGNLLEACPYWLWHSFLVGIAVCLKVRSRRARGLVWLRAVGTAVLVCIGLVAALYFMDWAAWYK